MKDILKKGVFTGLGLALATKDKLESIVEEVKAESEISEKEGEVLYNKLFEKSAEYRTDAEEFIEKIVNSTVEKLNLATKEDIDKINERLEKLDPTESEVLVEEISDSLDKLEPKES